MEVKADRRAADGKALDQDAATNSSAVRLASAASKVSTIAPSSPVAARSRNLVGLVGQPEQRFAGVERSARVRLEGQRRGRPAERSAARCCAAAITALWPRCTPSKLPMATTAPRSASWSERHRPQNRARRGNSSSASGLRWLRTGLRDASRSGAVASSRKVKGRAADRLRRRAVRPQRLTPCSNTRCSFAGWVGDGRGGIASPVDTANLARQRARLAPVAGLGAERWRSIRKCRARGRRLQHHGAHHPQSVAPARLRRHRRCRRRRRRAGEDGQPSATAS